jgi:hypothetical protein
MLPSNKCADSNPLLAELEDVVEQGFFNHLQLAEQASMGSFLLFLEERTQKINVVNTLC